MQHAVNAEQPVMNIANANANANAAAVMQPQALSVMPRVITPDVLLHIAVERNDGDLDRLERLANMVREWRKEQASLRFAEDFAAFCGENIIIPRSKHVDMVSRNGGQGPKFDQALYEDVCGRLSPVLSRHGFSFRHHPTFGSRKWVTDGVENDIPWVYVVCILLHRSGHEERLQLEGPPSDQSAMSPVQQMQSTASYLMRRSLLAITGTSTRDDPADDEAGLQPEAGFRPYPRNEAAPKDAELIRAGNAAAAKGMPELLRWWQGLTPETRAIATPSFAAMRAAAKKVKS